MIDSSRSPRPLWKRTLMTVLLIAFIVGFAWVIWVKELHHKDIHVRTLGVQLSALSGSPPLVSCPELRFGHLLNAR